MVDFMRFSLEMSSIISMEPMRLPFGLMSGWSGEVDVELLLADDQLGVHHRRFGARGPPRLQLVHAPRRCPR
jgi:hypothetical protein